MDGYYGQTAILFDDFYGGVKYTQLLKMLDGYPMQIGKKGGFVQKRWRTVLFTSNASPMEWYKRGLTPALKRRITSVTYWSMDGDPPNPKEDGHSDDWPI